MSDSPLDISDAEADRLADLVRFHALIAAMEDDEDSADPRAPDLGEGAA